MNEPPSSMGAPGLRGAAHRAGCPRSRGRAASVPPEVGRGPPLAAGAPNPGTGGGPGGGREDCGARQGPDSSSWVREKVLFLLHPERGLGTRVDPARLEAGGGDPESPAPHFPRQERVPGGRTDPPAGAPPRDPAAAPKPVLVRVVDYQVTQEVLWTAWTKGCMASRTEERSVTMVTFRTNKE